MAREATAPLDSPRDRRDAIRRTWLVAAVSSALAVALTFAATTLAVARLAAGAAGSARSVAGLRDNPGANILVPGRGAIYAPDFVPDLARLPGGPATAPHH